jgi:hypothetical protein
MQHKAKQMGRQLHETSEKAMARAACHEFEFWASSRLVDK